MLVGGSGGGVAGKWRMKKVKSRNSGLLPNSIRIISSCLKSVSSNAASTVRSAGASVAASISAASDDHKDQVLWAGFDKLELGPYAFNHVLLVGYQNGFQVLDVEDASNFKELVSKRDGPVTFLQMQPFPATSDVDKGFRSSHPLLLVVAGEDTNNLNVGVNYSPMGRLSTDGSFEFQSGNIVNSPMEVRFYSLKSHTYVHIVRFCSAVHMVRCSPRIVAVGLATQIYCFDALTLVNKFSVLTYPVPQLGGKGTIDVDIGYGPMAVGSRWLAYASNNPPMPNTGCISSKNLSSPGLSPSTSPGSGSLVARYAVESGKQLATSIINLGDKGYKSLSRYCQELLPDGSSSPVSSNSGWKVGRASASETDNAGMVVVKDYVSRDIISQFKAHTSPISALCFDPSGTLLVTASVHGNNLNIFRITPSCLRSGPGKSYDWSTSHVHLYKLHRGMTSAIIRDICFSHSSQWVAIVSSKGTCHIYVLSPLGGDTGFQTLNSQNEETSLSPIISPPWWSTSSYLFNQQSYSPPAPVSLSVVSRIRESYSGWLSTVSNAAASATGNVSVPSGAVAAVFYNSISHGFEHVNPKVKPLEHLLLYTPSGHVIQYELLPSVGSEPSEAASAIQYVSFVQTQGEDLRVNADPIQWWDACRRSDWPEMEECVNGNTLTSNSILKRSDFVDIHKLPLLVMSNYVGEKSLVRNDSVDPHERSHWYLSNAEVQINSSRLPIWQESKICLSMILPQSIEFCETGEYEIEKMTVNEVEFKRKDLLSFFDHFHSIKSCCNDGGLAAGRYPNSTSFMESNQAKEKSTEEIVICHSNPASLSSTETESSDGGSSRIMENLLDLVDIYSEKSYNSTNQISNDFSQERRGVSVEHSILSQKAVITASFPSNYFLSFGKAILQNVPSSNLAFLNVDSMLSTECHDFASNIFEEGKTVPIMLGAVNFGQCFQEGYCKTSNLEECCISGIVNDDVDSSKKCEEGKLEDDEENEEMFGDMFAFLQEG